MRLSFFLFLGLCLAVACSGPGAEPQPLCLPFGTPVDEWAGLLEEPADGVCVFEQIEVYPRPTEMRVDHAVIVTDAQGREVRRDEASGWDSVLDVSYTTEYDDEGRVSRETTDEGLDGVLEVDERWAYDENGQLTDWDRDTTFEAKSSIRNLYDAQGRLVRSETLLASSPGIGTDIEVWAYDDAGNLVLYQRRYAHKSEPHYRENWEYGPSGLLLRHLLDFDRDVEPELDERWTYDDQDRMVSYFKAEESPPRVQTEYREDWTWNGQVLQSHTIDADGDGQPNFVERWMWDDQGLEWVDERDENGDGVPDFRERHVFDGLQEEPVLLERDDDADGIIDYRETYTTANTRVLEDDFDDDGHADYSSSTTLTAKPLPLYDVPTSCDRLPKPTAESPARVPIEYWEDRNGDGELEEQETWRFDEQGRPLLHELTASNGYLNRIRFEYSQGWTTCRAFTRDWSTWEVTTTFDKRQTMRRLTYESRDLGGELQSRGVETFNRKGDLAYKTAEYEGVTRTESWTYLESCTFEAPQDDGELQHFSPPLRSIPRTAGGTPGRSFPASHLTDLDSDGHAESGERWTYDEQGRLLEYSEDLDGDGKLDRLMLWTYDSEGHLLAYLEDSHGNGWADQLDVLYQVGERDWTTTTGGQPSLVWRFDEHGRKLSKVTTPTSEDEPTEVVVWSYDEEHAQIALTHIEPGATNLWTFTGACNDELAERAPYWASWGNSVSW